MSSQQTNTVTADSKEFSPQDNPQGKTTDGETDKTSKVGTLPVVVGAWPKAAAPLTAAAKLSPATAAVSVGTSSLLRRLLLLLLWTAPRGGCAVLLTQLLTGHGPFGHISSCCCRCWSFSGARARRVADSRTPLRHYRWDDIIEKPGMRRNTDRAHTVKARRTAKHRGAMQRRGDRPCNSTNAVTAVAPWYNTRPVPNKDSTHFTTRT